MLQLSEKNIKKTALYLFSGVVFLMLGSFASNLSFPDSSYNFIGESKKTKLETEKYVTQVFIAQDDKLNQIKILIGNADLWPGEKVLLELASPDCQTILASGTYSFFSPRPHIYYHFNFPTISDSKGKEYCLKIGYSSPFDKGDERPYIAASDSETFTNSFYTDTKNKVFIGRTLQIRPAYGTGSFLGDLERLIDRLSQYKPGFIKGLPMGILLVTTLLGSVLLGFWIIFSRDPEQTP